jgi:hypothetical protein
MCPPDDSGGIYSVPVGTLVTTGDTVLPSQHNPWANDSATAISNRFSKDGRAPATGNWNMNGFRIAGLGAPASANDAATKTYVDATGLKYSLKTASYLAAAADDATFMRFSATATLSLTAAATLAADWWVFVVADGGNVTIDPNGAETIDGAGTLVVPNGTSVTVICNGTAFFTSKLTIPVTRQIIAGNGLTGAGPLTADVTVTMGTPGTLTASTTNAVTSVSHTHVIDEDSIVSVGMAALAAGAIGTYATAYTIDGSSNNFGATEAGSNLRPASASSGGAAGSGNLSGTWRCMGYGPNITTYLRIS